MTRQLSDDLNASVLNAKRHGELDFLRGCMLVMMTLDHLLWSAFHSIGFISETTYEFFGAVSSADGFVFLSGIVAGLVYSRIVLRNKMLEARQRIIRRVKELYLINVFCIGLLAMGAILFKGHGSSMASNPYYQNPLITLFFGALHLSLPSFFDILPIYCYFLLLLLPLLSEFAKGRIWVFLIFSIVCWFVGQFSPFQRIEVTLNTAFSPRLPFNLGFFDAFAWQLLFVVGAILGCLKTKGTLPLFIIAPKRVLFGLAVLVTLILFLIRHHVLLISPLLIDKFTDVRTLGLLRLVGLACLGYIILVLVPRFPRVFNFRPLVFLGQHSLYVYAFHALLCYCLTALTARYLVHVSLVVNLLALLLALASLWIPAFLHQKWRTYGHQTSRKFFHYNLSVTNY